jgi:hypothetical protein
MYLLSGAVSVTGKDREGGGEGWGEGAGEREGKGGGRGVGWEMDYLFIPTEVKRNKNASSNIYQVREWRERDENFP